MAPWLTLPCDWRRPGVTARYTLYWSDADQYGMLHPRPTPEQSAEFYQLDDYYTHRAEAEAARPLTLAERLRIRIAWQFDRGSEIDAAWLRHHYPAGSARVLDIGCGSGRILALLHAAGHTVIGVEPDEAARSVAQQRGLTVLPGTAEALPAGLAGQSFDLIVLTHVLEHCLDPVQALRNATALLAPGGKLVVETPNNAAVGRKRAGPTWRWLDVPRHLNFFTPHSLQSAARLAGLQPLTLEYRGYTRQFQPDWIADERLIRERLLENGTPAADLPPANSSRRAWQLLWRTLSAESAERYDSVRLIATLPTTQPD
jgi:2-polyprenyl-3-methyl-5-hydroxy-6-metoxy-1,4-benzoquinol methylase